MNPITGIRCITITIQFDIQYINCKKGGAVSKPTPAATYGIICHKQNAKD